MPVKISDVIVPEIFVPYVQRLTTEKSALIQSGVLAKDAQIDKLLTGGGLTFSLPAWKPLGNEAENTSTDDETSSAVPKKIGTMAEIAVRISRNQSWSAMDLSATLAGADPMTAIGNQVANYWTLRLQAAYIATMQGVFADNAAAPSGNDTHQQNDMTVDISGVSYDEGVTDFSAEAFIDACVTMGDGMGDLTAVAMHSIVYARAQKNNLIDFIPDSEGKVNIPTFLGRRVIVDDGLPNPAGVGAAQTSTGIFHTWILGTNSARFGEGTPEVPFETFRDALAGDGGGMEGIISRVEWVIAPTGYAYIGTPDEAGGPTNAATSNNLAAASSWSRRYPERKMIRVARLITRES